MRQADVLRRGDSRFVKGCGRQTSERGGGRHFRLCLWPAFVNEGVWQADTYWGGGQAAQGVSRQQEERKGWGRGDTKVEGVVTG